MKELRNIFLLFTLMFVFVALEAQNIDNIGYVNSDELLEEMTELPAAKEKINTLNENYKEELRVMELDYNKKYVDFMSLQNSMSENIKLRRMQELYELEKHIDEFIEVAKEDVLAQENELLQPLRQRIKDAIFAVGIRNDMHCIYDLANPAIAFVTPDAKDLNQLVLEELLGVHGVVKAIKRVE